MPAIDWNRLDVAAYRVSVKRSVRRQAWFLPIIGVIVAVCGVAGGLVPMAVIGAVIFVAGAWNLYRPTVTGLVVDGVALILTGVFSALAWIWFDDARPSSAARWVVTGAFQVAWGVRRIVFYATARRVVNDPPAIARLESIVRELSKRKAGTDPAVVEFRTGRFHRHLNRLGLYEKGVIGLLQEQVVRLERRPDVWVEAIGTTAFSRSVKVSIQMGELRLIGHMPTAHFERFERWKSRLSEPLLLAA